MRFLRGLFADPSRLADAWYDAAIDEFMRVFNIRANRLAIFSALRHVYLDEPFGESGFWDRLPTLRPPALFLWGDHDNLVPAGFGRFVAEALPQAESVVIESCGHVPQFEHPDLTARLTRDFIAALPARLSPLPSRPAIAACRSERGDELVGGRVRVGLAGHDARRGRIERRRAVHAGEALAHLAQRDRLDLAGRPGPAAALQLAVALHPVEVLRDRGDDVVDALRSATRRS